MHQTPSTAKHALRDAELTGSRERDSQSILYLSPLARSKDNFSVERVDEDSFNLKEELRVKKYEV